MNEEGDKNSALTPDAPGIEAAKLPCPWWRRPAVLSVLAAGLFLLAAGVYARSYGVPPWVPESKRLNAWLGPPSSVPS